MMQRPVGIATVLCAEIASHLRSDAHPHADAASHDVLERTVRTAADNQGGVTFPLGRGRACAAFQTASSAARAAIACQQALAAAASVESTLRVRMALHTGECERHDDAYAGAAVERAARLVAAAHGGQVLVSEHAALLLREAGAAFELVDLGSHRLRDLGRPELVHQLSVPDLRTSFPAIRSLDNPDLPNNLPVLLSAFVGRLDEIDEVHRLLDEARLVTLTGAGGAGKTRLALQAAAEVLDAARDGVWLVELASVRDASQVPAAVVAALEIRDADADAVELLVASLSAQRALIVFDNCEHLVEPCAKVIDAILRACPGVQVLATSREPLGLQGERVYRVPSMSLPDEDALTPSEARSSDAVSLFIGRAKELGVAVPYDDALLVASVCRRLDGIPLAIELAAARLTSLSVSELSERLDQRFRLLTGGTRSVMARQQTLQALVDWSYELLCPSEQTALQRLSVFAGPFELKAAEAVCALDRAEPVDDVVVVNLVHSLVEKSLVIAERTEGSTRYRLLETIRQYAAAELLRSEGDLGVLEARDRHADYFLAVARAAAPKLSGPEVGEWIRRLELDAANLRAAIAHLVEDRPLEVLELVASLERFFNLRAAVDVLGPTLTAVSKVDHGDRRSAEAAAAALISACVIIGWHLIGQREEMDASLRYVERAEQLARQVRRTDLEARALMYHAHVALYRGERESAAGYLRRAEQFARQCRSAPILCDVLVSSLHPLLVEHEGWSDAQVYERADEALRVATDAQDHTMVARAKFWYATQALGEERLDESRRLYEETLELTHEIGAYDGTTLNNYLIVCLAQDDYAAAISPLKVCLRRMRRSGFRSNPGDLLAAAACVATARGDAVVGAQLHAAADEIRAPAYATGELYRTPADERMEQRSVERSRTLIGQVEFDKAYEEGRSLTTGEACDLALAAV